MSTLVVLDYCTESVLFIRLDDEMIRQLVDDYENDSEAWIAETDLEERFGFCMHSANWMVVDGEPEIYRNSLSSDEMTRVHLFM